MSAESYRCDACRKYITVTKAGVFRHHRGHEKEYPGSPWRKVCEGAGKKP